jgi:hypothetical protein
MKFRPRESLRPINYISTLSEIEFNAVEIDEAEPEMLLEKLNSLCKNQQGPICKDWRFAEELTAIKTFNLCFAIREGQGLESPQPLLAER